MKQVVLDRGAGLDDSRAKFACPRLGHGCVPDQLLVVQESGVRCSDRRMFG
jgi:hypothetical protein